MPPSPAKRPRSTITTAGRPHFRHHFKLTAHTARQVIMWRFSPKFKNLRFRSKQAHTLAQEFSVSVKTIRDIWNQKTWKEVTNNIFVELSRLSTVDNILFTWYEYYNIWQPQSMVVGVVDPFADDLKAMYAPYLNEIMVPIGEDPIRTYSDAIRAVAAPTAPTSPAITTVDSSV